MGRPPSDLDDYLDWRDPLDVAIETTEGHLMVVEASNHWTVVT